MQTLLYGKYQKSVWRDEDPDVSMRDLLQRAKREILWLVQS